MLLILILTLLNGVEALRHISGRRHKGALTAARMRGSLHTRS